MTESREPNDWDRCGSDTPELPVRHAATGSGRRDPAWRNHPIFYNLAWNLVW